MLGRNWGILLVFMVLGSGMDALAQEESESKAEKKDKWYRSFSIRGYFQVRYNRLGETNRNLQCEQCDRSMGGNGGFFLRRMRLVVEGDISDRVSVYIQPDFASSTSNGLNYGQLRDAYFDFALDKNKTWRIRLGQTKIPYGFEAMQSSSNRLPLDRSDGINSSILNERDLGAFLYWAPKEKRELFERLTDDGLKGSGDFGVVGLGLFNGQVNNKSDQNRNVHAVGRFTWPVELSNGQIVEGAIQAYTGKFTVSDTTGGVKIGEPNSSFTDQRVAASFVWYPQPFGLQGEYNVGTGPEYDPATNSILQKKLQGGYVMANYFIKPGSTVLIPFVRYHYYDGGKKYELDARSYGVQEFELGAEWQINKNVELVAMYTISKRRFEDGAKPDNDQSGQLIRLQAQLSF